MPTITKARISPPLEAGPSLLDSKQLPPKLTDALDYVSSRLARKRLHLSLIVIRKDIQIPVSPPNTPPLNPPSPALSLLTSPAKSIFTPITRQLSKPSSIRSLSSRSSNDFSRTQHPSLPSSPKPTSPVVASSPVSSTSSESSSPSLSPSTSPTIPNQYGLSLLHATTLTPKAEKILRQTIAKAEKKFGIGSGWLSSQPLSTSSTCAMTNDLIRRSITQNEVIFGSEGLSLLSLDHVYTFKCCLHTYSRSLTPETLTAAVDELRRLVLAQQGRPITKGYLMRAYDWLGVSLAALVDVNEGYKTAYGGAARNGGIEVLSEERKSPPPLQTNFKLQPIPSRPHRPKLSLAYTTEPEEVSKSTKVKDPRLSPTPARSVMDSPARAVAKFYEFDLTEYREDRGPHRRGPLTPNGFEDITPVTKGEWCYLMVGDGWKAAKTAAVETC